MLALLLALQFEPPETVPGNLDSSIVIIMADDISAYDLTQTPTPNLDQLKAQSADFIQARTTAPMCSPSRTWLTGLYPHRVGIGRIVQSGAAQPGLQEDIDTIADFLGAAGLTTCTVGKWHLNNFADGDIGNAPARAGFHNWRAHTTGNLQVTTPNGDYTNWGRWDDGVASTSTLYATDEQAREARIWWNQTGGQKFLLLSFNTAHNPYHDPPGFPPAGTVRQQYLNMIASMDTAIGAFLSEANNIDDAYVFFWSDNGPDDEVLQDPPQVLGHDKMTLYEGGIRTPLYVKGPGVDPGPRTALVSIVDVYATIMDLIGEPVPPGLDSLSFADTIGGTSTTEERQYAYAERFGPNFDPDNTPFYSSRERMVTDGRFKLLVEEDRIGGILTETKRELLDLRIDPREECPITKPAKEAELQAVMDAIE